MSGVFLANEYSNDCISARNQLGYVLQWMTGQAQQARVDINLGFVQLMYGWNPQANGKINKNTGLTSWITDRGTRQFASQLNVSEMSEMFTGSPIY